MADVVTRLERKMRKRMLSDLPEDERLADMGFSDLLHAYGNWRARQVSARPRRVHWSTELENSPASEEHAEALALIASQIESGEDLTPRLSKSSREVLHPGGLDGVAHHRRRDRDLLRSDWGIHHLHLGLDLEQNGFFIKRTNDLLFAIFKPDDAYLLNVYPHQSWGRQDMVRIAISNWPEADLFLKLESVIGLSQQFNDDERLQLRNSGVAGLLEIDGAVYMPALGQTMDGTPIAVTRQAMNLQWNLDDVRRNVRDRLPIHFEGEFRYWVPLIHGDDCGFRAGDQIAIIGTLPGGDPGPRPKPRPHADAQRSLPPVL